MRAKREARILVPHACGEGILLAIVMRGCQRLEKLFIGFTPEQLVRLLAGSRILGEVRYWTLITHSDPASTILEVLARQGYKLAPCPGFSCASGCNVDHVARSLSILLERLCASLAGISGGKAYKTG